DVFLLTKEPISDQSKTYFKITIKLPFICKRRLKQLAVINQMQTLMQQR
ncbi:hypothetical protein LINGRAHAP2_LOCUS24588, partial [Linum grandiflorum]